jgi:hypothetical protein
VHSAMELTALASAHKCRSTNFVHRMDQQLCCSSTVPCVTSLTSMLQLPAGLKDPAGQLARRMKLAQVGVAQQSGDVQRALQLLRELAEAGGEDAKMQVQVLLGDVQYEVSTVGCCCCCCSSSSVVEKGLSVSTCLLLAATSSCGTVGAMCCRMCVC